MKIVLRGTKQNYDQHRVLIFTGHVPNWIERVILRKKFKLVNYVGAGGKWKRMSVNGQVQLHDVTSKRLIEILRAWYNGEQFYQRNKN